MTGRKALLATALRSLNAREQHVLRERRLKDSPATLEDLSRRYNVSRERMRQIEAKAIDKLREAMNVKTETSRELNAVVNGTQPVNRLREFTK